MMTEKVLYHHIDLMTNFASHDIKNVIHNLDGVINTLDEGKFSAEELSTINSCLDSLRKSIIEFQQIRPDQSKNEFKLYELSNILEILNRSLLNQHQVKCEYSVDKSCLVAISHNLHDIVQAINNLFINSVKALESISEKKISIQFEIINQDVIIFVRDNGCGIEEQHRNRVFDLHFSTRKNGTGIGLYHARYTFEKIKGSIELLPNNPSLLTTFKIKFPIK